MIPCHHVRLSLLLILNIHGEQVDDPITIAEALKTQYESAFSTPLPDMLIENPHEFFHSEDSDSEDSTICDFECSTDDIKETIKNLSSTSAAGPDGVPAILLKKCSKSLSIPLANVLNATLKTRKIPSLQTTGA